MDLSNNFWPNLGKGIKKERSRYLENSIENGVSRWAKVDIGTRLI